MKGNTNFGIYLWLLIVKNLDYSYHQEQMNDASICMCVVNLLEPSTTSVFRRWHARYTYQRPSTFATNMRYIALNNCVEEVDRKGRSSSPGRALSQGYCTNVAYLRFPCM